MYHLQYCLTNAFTINFYISESDTCIIFANRSAAFINISCTCKTEIRFLTVIKFGI